LVNLENKENSTMTFRARHWKGIRMEKGKKKERYRHVLNKKQRSMRGFCKDRLREKPGKKIGDEGKL